MGGRLDDIPIEAGSGNVFADLGFDQPEEELAKADLAIRIKGIIEERGLTQSDAARVLGLHQPEVSALLNGRTGAFSLARILKLLTTLDNNVSIVVEPTRHGRGRLNVVAR
jgi:predicted XRE-type DNA-binding protein